MSNLAYLPDPVSRFDGTIDGIRPLVPEGIYTLGYFGHYTYRYLGKIPKLALVFAIMDPGDYFECQVERIYNVKRLIGKQGKGGKFEAGRSSRFVYEYCRACTDRITRLDRISMSSLKSQLYQGRIETVTKNYEQLELPVILQYSVVRELLGLSM